MAKHKSPICEGRQNRGCQNRGCQNRGCQNRRITVPLQNTATELFATEIIFFRKPSFKV